MLDVIIPCRNAPDTLWLTLTHFWAHAYSRRWVRNVLLIDNGSTDPRVRPILQYAKTRYAQTHHVIYNDRNVGLWCSINRALAAARSDRVFVLTSDVLLAENTFGPLLDVFAVHPTVAMVGPEVFTGLGNVPSLVTETQARITLDTSTYNGAAWLLRWDCLRERVGWYDPRFYVCAGDTDYTERIRRAGLHTAVARGVPCVHLDKATRRADGNAVADTEVEIKDMLEFHAKWKDVPDVTAKHPLPDKARYVQYKEQRGWGASDAWKGL